jgi:hypothetical protein
MNADEIQEIKDQVRALDDDALLKQAWDLFSSDPPLNRPLVEERRRLIKQAEDELRGSSRERADALQRLRRFCVTELISRRSR